MSNFSKDKIFFHTLFVISFLIIAPALFSAEGSPFIEENRFRGGWRCGIVTQRRVLVAEAERVVASAEVDFSTPGKYHLLAYVHHQWVRANPFFCMEIIDRNSALYTGCHGVENLWYLQHPDAGRWFWITPGPLPFLELPQGKFLFRIWAEGRRTSWDLVPVGMEGPVALDFLFLLPVQTAGGVMQSFAPLDPENFIPNAAEMGWHLVPYDNVFATGFIEADKCGADIAYEWAAPSGAFYKFYLSVFAPQGGQLKIATVQKGMRQSFEMKIPENPYWQIVETPSFYLTAGTCNFVLTNLAPQPLKIDFIFPCPEESVKVAFPDIEN